MNNKEEIFNDVIKLAAPNGVTESEGLPNLILQREMFHRDTHNEAIGKSGLVSFRMSFLGEDFHTAVRQADKAFELLMDTEGILQSDIGGLVNRSAKGDGGKKFDSLRSATKPDVSFVVEARLTFEEACLHLLSLGVNNQSRPFKRLTSEDQNSYINKFVSNSEHAGKEVYMKTVKIKSHTVISESEFRVIVLGLFAKAVDIKYRVNEPSDDLESFELEAEFTLFRVI